MSLANQSCYDYLIATFPNSLECLYKVKDIIGIFAQNFPKAMQFAVCLGAEYLKAEEIVRCDDLLRIMWNYFKNNKLIDFVKIMIRLGEDKALFKILPDLKVLVSQITVVQFFMQTNLSTILEPQGDMKLRDFLENGQDGKVLQRIIVLSNLFNAYEEYSRFAVRLGSACTKAMAMNFNDIYDHFLNYIKKDTTLHDFIIIFKQLNKTNDLCNLFPELRSLCFMNSCVVDPNIEPDVVPDANTYVYAYLEVSTMPMIALERIIALMKLISYNERAKFILATNKYRAHDFQVQWSTTAMVDDKMLMNEFRIWMEGSAQVGQLIKIMTEDLKISHTFYHLFPKLRTFGMPTLIVSASRPVASAPTPVASSLKSSKKRQSEAKMPECCVCMEKCPNMMTQECRHLCMCEECYDGIQKKDTCPICNTRPVKFIKIFVS